MSASEFTVRKASEIWLRKCKIDGLERSTIRSYEQHVRLHILPRIGEVDLKSMTAADAHDFRDQLLSELSKSMAKKVLGSFKSLVSEAHIRGHIQQDVARPIRIKVSRRGTQERRMPSKEELLLLLSKCPAEHKPYFFTAIFTGMRASEMRGLTWENVDFERSIIRVRQRADRWNEIGDPKSASGRREIPMTPKVIKALSLWKRLKQAGEKDLVFPNGAGNIENHSNIYNRIFKPLMTQCGLVDEEGKVLFPMHALRHATASLLIEQGWNPKKVQRMMGHSSIAMTFDVYGHLMDDAEADVPKMAALEESLSAA